MTILMVKLAKENLVAAVAALAPFAAPEGIQLFEPIPMHTESEDKGLLKLAEAVVAAVAPKATQPLRQEALRKLLGGHDTYWGQEGAADPSLRNAIGAISKDLKGLFKHDKAVRRLAVPKKTYFPDGNYRGTVYLLTPLGKRVGEILRSMNLI